MLIAGLLLALTAASFGTTAFATGAAGGKETGLQGQVPLSDQESGRSQRPYTDNMRLIGQSDMGNRGMNGNLGWLDDDDCAYVSAYFGADDPDAGLAVIDASNPRKPQHVETWPGTPGTRESQVEGNTAKRMVVVMPFSASTPFGDPQGPSELQFYTAGDDCTDLTRRGTYEFGSVHPHEHRISEDGNTVYVAILNNRDDALQVVDSSDPDNPELLTTWDWEHEGGERSVIHDLDVTADGNRAYVNITGGLAILDTSEVQARVPNPEVKFISAVHWREGLSHSAQLAHIDGRTYIIAQDEVFTTRRCPWGRARIIDVTDEQNPVQVSIMDLEVNLAENCEQTLQDNAMYSTHYLGVDSVEDTTMAFLTWYSSGLRVFDIRDPHNPKEIGYYNPGARTDTKFVDSQNSRFGNNLVDYTYSFVRYRPESGHIWFTSIYNGFQIVKLIRDLDVLDKAATGGQP